MYREHIFHIKSQYAAQTYLPNLLFKEIDFVEDPTWLTLQNVTLKVLFLYQINIRLLFFKIFGEKGTV